MSFKQCFYSASRTRHMARFAQVGFQHTIPRFFLVFFEVLLIVSFLIRQIHSNSLLIGALHSNDGTNNSIELEEEIVFKHAIYISNQLKPTSPSNQGVNLPFSTLLHKLVRLNNLNQIKAIKKICKETSGNLVALVGPSDNTLNLYVKSLCEELDIVHFSVEPSLDYSSSASESYSFNLYPSTTVLCQAFADLVRKFEWKHAAIIYNSKTNMKKVRCLLGAPDQTRPKLDMSLNIANTQYDYRPILRDISKRSIRNIILDLEPDEAQVVLKMALQLGMINSTYHYVLTSLDVETLDLEDFKYNRANLTSLRLIKTDSSFYRSIALNLSDYSNQLAKSEYEKQKILLKTKNALIFDAIYTFAMAVKEAERTLTLTDGSVSCQENRPLKHGHLLNSYVERISTNGLTGPISFQNKKRKSFELDVLQLKEVGMFKCGSWSTENGLNFTFYEEKYEEDLSLDKNKFKVVTLVETPYVIEEKNGKFKGFCIDLLDEIAQKMNFKYEIYKVADNQYGTEDANGSWNGMIRELMDKKADLAISAFTINFKRQQVVDFTKPFLSLGISILYRVPTSKKPGLFSFLNPLSLEIWIYTLITYILVSLIMMVLARFSPYEWRNTHPCNFNNDLVENQFTAWNSLWFAVGTLMQQGSDINPKALSTRLVGGVWWFFTLIIISSYTANLAAFLTVEKVDISITNVEELANQTKIKYGVFKGGSTMNFFKESRIDTYKRMWKEMEKSSDIAYVTSNDEGIQRVLTTDFAYLMESPLIDYAIQKNCNLTQIGGLLDSKGYGIATQLGSPYTDDISLKILEMQEKGEIQKLYNRWWKSGSTCMRDEKKDSKAAALNVENVGGIFVVLVGGLLLAILVSFIEFLYYAKRNSSKIKKSVCRLMADELRFAVKCGGSAKKLQLSSTTAIQIKNPAAIKKELAEGTTLYTKPVTIQHQQQHQQRSSSNNLPQQQASILSSNNKSDCRKCEEIIRNELLDSLTPTNALVCKHNSQANMSTLNPSLLIVDRDVIDGTQEQALQNSQVLPHSHLNISHDKAKQLFYQQHALNARKEFKKQKSFSTNESTTTDDDLYYLSNAHLTSGQANPGEDQMQMKEFILDSTTFSSPIAFLKPNKQPVKQLQHVSKKQQFIANTKSVPKFQPTEQHQVTRRNVPIYGQEIPINIACNNDSASKQYAAQHRSNQQSMERERAHQREMTSQQEQQINYEKYLSKSTIVKQSFNRS